ncbi:MAG TPA: hypothetical protein VGE98_16795 [Thermoanaerobaculia bacterium]
MLGGAVFLQTTGDPAFAALSQFSRWNGEVLRTVLAVSSVAALLLFATATIALPRLSLTAYRRAKLATLTVLVLTAVALPIGQRAFLRFASGHPLRFAHDGGVVQTEESARFLLRGENPYAADFSATPLREAGIPAVLQHNPYLPGSFLLAVPFVAAADAAGLPFDMRLVYLALYGFAIAVVPLAFRGAGTGEVARTGFALAPLVVPFLVVGRNDVAFLAFLLFALVALARRRATGFFLGLAAACATKQLAWFVAPFLLVHAWHALPRPAFRRGVLWGAALFAAVVVPFVAWGPADFWDDVYRFNAGLGTSPYPLGGTPGFGFAMLAADLGWAADRNAYYPLTPYLLATAAPLALWLLWRLNRRPSLAFAVLSAFLVSFWVLFFARVFNNNYLGFLAFLVQMGALFAVDERRAME